MGNQVGAIGQAVILAGGLGTRLGEKTRETPKPLLPVGGKPFLEYIVWNLKRQGVTRLVFCVGYLADKIMAHFGDGRRHGVCIDYVIEGKPAGTGGAVLLATPHLEDEFFVLNGDTLFDADYRRLALLLGRSGAAATLALRHVPDSGRYGAVWTCGEHVIGFQEKSEAGPGLVNGGIYAMRREALSSLPPAPCSLEHHLLPKLAAAGQLAGTSCAGYFIDIGLLDTLRAADYGLPLWQRETEHVLQQQQLKAA